MHPLQYRHLEVIARMRRHPDVLLGSYPSFEGVPHVEVVVKSGDAAALAAAIAWIEPELEQATAAG